MNREIERIARIGGNHHVSPNFYDEHHKRFYRCFNYPDGTGTVYEWKLDNDRCLVREWGLVPNRTLKPQLLTGWIKDGGRTYWEGLLKSEREITFP